MRKIFSVILLLIILCGCKSTAKITPVTRDITFVCEANYYNETYKCKCDVEKNGDTTIEFTYPADIEGLRFAFSKNGVSVNYRELQYISEKIVFENSVASLINEALSLTDTEVFEENDVFYTEGVNNEFEYKLQLGATGLPIKITTRPDIAQIVFKKVKIK